MTGRVKENLAAGLFILSIGIMVAFFETIYFFVGLYHHLKRGVFGNGN